jgi:hypothetical protein
MLVGGATGGRQRADRPDLLTPDDPGAPLTAGVARVAGEPLSIDLRLRRRPLDNAQPDGDDVDRARASVAPPSDWGAASAQPLRPPLCWPPDRRP